MTKIDLGQTIQIIANVGVIAGIVFLGYEMRQNTQVARQEAYSSFTQSITDVNTTLMSNSELAEIVARAREGARRSDFSPTEQFQYDLTIVSLVRVFEGLYQSLEEGIVDESYFDTIREGTGPWSQDYFREYWPIVRQTFDPEFVEFFEERLPE